MTSGSNNSNFQPETQPYQPRNTFPAPAAPDTHPDSRPLHRHPQWNAFLKLLNGTLYLTPSEHRGPFLELLKQADRL